MSLMGHSLGDDPQATYTHVELPLKRDAIAKLEVWLAEQRKERTLQKQPKGDN